MPYKDPEKRKAAQKKANKNFRENHPEQIAEIQAQWYQSNREKSLARVAQWRKDHPEAGFNRHLLKNYGLTREQYDAMIVAQGGKCAICDEVPVPRTGQKNFRIFDVDHCHATNRVRGLLCHRCNVMLGQARDRPEVLQAAILYLSRAQVS